MFRLDETAIIRLHVLETYKREIICMYISMYVCMYVDFKTSFYVVRHLDSTVPIFPLAFI